MRRARSQTSRTADPVAAQACVIWSIAIDRAVREGHLDGVRDGVAALDDAAARRYWGSRLDEAETMVPSDFAKNGWVVQALQGAWSAITHAEGAPGPQKLRSGLEGAVAGGRDTDTVAAIAGGLLGAAYGASAIPWKWKEHLHGWPGLLDVVVSLCRTGTKEVRPGAEHVEIWLVDAPYPEDNPNLEFVFADTANLIARRRDDGKTVFLHCVQWGASNTGGRSCILGPESQRRSR